MNKGTIAAALLAGAGLLHLGYTVPARRQAQGLAEDHRRALGRRREVQERRQRAERHQAEYARVVAVLASAARGSEDPAGEGRRFVLGALRDAGLVGVRVTVGPGHESEGATIQVAGRGRIEDVVRFSGALVQPHAGIVLERVRLSGLPTAIGFEIAGVRLRGPR